MKKSLIVVSFIIGITALWFIFEKIPFQEVIDTFLEASPTAVITYIVISIGIMFVTTWRWHVVMKSQHLNVPFFSSLIYKIVGYGVSFMTPAAKLGGEPVRAALLTRQGLKFSKALSTVVIDKTIDVMCSGIFFAVGVVIIILKYALPGSTQILLSIVAILIIIIIIKFYKKILKGQGLIIDVLKLLRLNRLKSVRNNKRKIQVFERRIIKFYKHDKEDFIITIMISALSWMLMFLEYKFALMIFGFDVSWTQVFFIFSFIGIAYIIPIPFALGSLEASQITVFTLVGLKASGGVALSLLTRARDFVWMIVGLLALAYFGLNIENILKKAYNNSKG